jgi:uncharacterized protein (DUF983 family)
MNMQQDDTLGNPGILQLLACKCPRCRRGKMFVNATYSKHFMKMHDECPVCKQQFDLEVGFYYGTGFVSYALTVAFTLLTFALWWFILGFSIDDNSIFYWLAINAVIMLALQPYFMRFSRTMWLAFFVRYDPQWKTRPPKPLERTNESQKNAW